MGSSSWQPAGCVADVGYAGYYLDFVDLRGMAHAVGTAIVTDVAVLAVCACWIWP